MATAYWALLAASCFGTLGSAFAAVVTCRRFMLERDAARADAAMAYEAAAFCTDLAKHAIAREKAARERSVS